MEGNEVSLFIENKVYKDVFENLLPKCDNPDNFIDSNTIILFDMSGSGNIADEYKKKGHLVYGAGKFCDDLEHDRNFGFKCMKESGILVPDYKEFTDFKTAIDFVRENADKKLVFKPNGSMPTKLTYISEDAYQLVEYLKFIEARFRKDIKSFILQDFIEGSVISSEFFCSNGEFLWPPNHTVEVKKSMNGELGPSTGCSGNITWNCTSEIISDGVYRIAKIVKENKYTGQIDLNSVVNKHGVYGLEWTPRMGYDATPTYLTLVNKDLGKFFSDCCRGQSVASNISDSNDYAVSIRLSIPPYPMETDIDTEKISPNKGIPIQNWEDCQDNLYFYEVMLNDEERLVHSGGTGVICLVINTGEDIDSCMTKIYDTLEDIKIPDKQYRTDLDKVLPEMVEEVKEYYGY